MQAACAECQKIIDAPTAPENSEPHPMLRSDGHRKSTYGEASSQRCDVCGTTFKRLEKDGAVQWTLSAL